MSWPALVVLMALGNGSDPSLSGVVHVRDVQPDDTQTDVVLPGVGPVRIEEGRHRVAKRGNLVRREHLDGRPMAIFGHDTKWIWLDGAELPTAFSSAVWGWDDQLLVQRRPLSRWEGDDFTHPTGAVSPTTMLGRAAWSVELAPPAHKPFPLTLVVDAETGIVLQERNDGFGSVTEWVENCPTTCLSGLANLSSRTTGGSTANARWHRAATGSRSVGSVTSGGQSRPRWTCTNGTTRQANSRQASIST
jgi:hypothetical protein